MRLKKLSQITIINFSLANVASTIFPGKTTNVVISSICLYTLILLYFNQYNYFKNVNFIGKKVVFLFLSIGVLVTIYSLFMSSNYYEFNYLFIVFVPSLLFPLIVMLATNIEYLFILIKSLIIYSIPISFILYFTKSNFDSMNDFTGFIAFIYLLILFIPFVKTSSKIFIIFIAVLSLFYNLDDRTNLLMILLCVFQVILYYFLKALKKKFILLSSFRLQRIILLFLPFILLILGITGIYNIFKSSDKEEIRTSTYIENVSTTDSRTFLYDDVLTDLYTNNKLIFGLSATGKYKSSLMYFYTEDEVYKNGRLGVEVGVLEYLLRGGLIYFLAFFALIVSSTKIALFHSNNDFSKLLGIYILIYWVISFIELQPGPQMWSLSLFIAIGAAYNPTVRKMNNIQIINFFKKLNPTIRILN